MPSPNALRIITSAPRGLPVTRGLNLWTRASAIPLASTSAVQTYSDLSGSGNDLTQGTSANRPVVYSGAGPMNDEKTYLQFSDNALGTKHVIGNSSYSINKQAFTFFWIGSLQAIDGTMYILDIASLGYVVMVQNGTFQTFLGSAVDSTLKAPTQRRIAIAVTFDSTGRTLYVDGRSVAFSQAAITAGTFTGFNLGSTAGVFYGTNSEVACYNRVLTATELDAMFRYASQRYGASVVTPTGRVVFDGDSVTFGLGATRGRSIQSFLNIRRDWLGYNHGVVGQTITQMSADQSEPNVFANSTNWLFVEGGYNDLTALATGATVEGRLNTYCTAAISAGYAKANIVVETLSCASSTTERDNANTLIRANYTGYAGWLIDVAADSQLGVNAGSGLKVPGNFYDGVHPNDTGYNLKAALMRSTIGASLPF